MVKLTAVDHQILDVISQHGEWYSLLRLTNTCCLQYKYTWMRVQRMEKMGLLMVERYARRPMCLKINGGKHE